LPDLSDITAAEAQLAPPKSKLPHFRELDGLRGIAALAVFIHHFFQPATLQSLEPWNWFFRITIYLSKFGANGVDIFFVLSGYLITALLLIDRGKPNYFHNFYWKRVLRILPVYLVHLILTQWIVGDAWGYIWLSLIFLVNFSQRFHVEEKGVAWTLSIEEQFYLIWPQFVRRLRISSLYYLAFALVFTSIILRIMLPLLTGKIAITYTPYRCDGLGLGAILALQWFDSGRAPRLVQPLLRILNANLTLVVALASAAMLICLPTGNLLLTGARITAVNFLAYRLICRIIQTNKPPAALTWLGRGVPVYMGNISYSLYLYHLIILFLLARHFQMVDPSHPWKIAGMFILALSASIAMSTLSLYAMELPVQRLRRFTLK